jgi:hypothetical protein
MTQDILELAKEFGCLVVGGVVEKITSRVKGDVIFRGSELEAFAAALREKDLARIASLEWSMRRILEECEANDHVLLDSIESRANEALSNKSDWLAKHELNAQQPNPLVTPYHVIDSPKSE